MPYLHWEIETRLRRMSKIVQTQTAAEQKKAGSKRGIIYKSKIADLSSNWRIRLGRPPPVEKKEAKPWRPHKPLARYLWFASKLFELIDEAADERLIREHLFSPSQLHVRRTLDQFYYWTVEDTTTQDRSQVVCHGTRSSNDEAATGRVVMVDQLWMWILDQSKAYRLF